MTELDQIYSAWQDASVRGESGVLATVVRVQGSTYRRASARLLMTSGGRRVGSVSGGCLEADLVKKGWWLTESGRAAIRKYDTSVEGELAQEFGLGCNGVIHVLLERLGVGSVSPLSMVPVVRHFRRPGFLATVIESNNGSIVRVGQRWARLPDGSITTDIANNSVANFAQAATVTIDLSPLVLTYEDRELRVDLFIEPVLPTPRLLVFGAGDDALPVVRLAKFMGYEVIVLDGRSHMARTERFPGADGVLVTSSGDALAGAPLDDWTAAVVMSHSYAQDLAALHALAAYPLPYLGMLGPRKRTERLLSEAGITPAGVADALHSPIGLDIGADGAEQIALAIIAEIQSVLNRRAGGRLREKAGPLHLSNRHGQEPLYSLPRACPMG
jgi:xanthine/CO dehydrogenase XdhC/CoxF family maturation factor